MFFFKPFKIGSLSLSCVVYTPWWFYYYVIILNWLQKVLLFLDCINLNYEWRWTIRKEMQVLISQWRKQSQCHHLWIHIWKKLTIDPRVVLWGYYWWSGSSGGAEDWRVKSQERKDSFQVWVKWGRLIVAGGSRIRRRMRKSYWGLRLRKKVELIFVMWTWDRQSNVQKVLELKPLRSYFILLLL